MESMLFHGNVLPHASQGNTIEAMLLTELYCRVLALSRFITCRDGTGRFRSGILFLVRKCVPHMQGRSRSGRSRWHRVNLIQCCRNVARGARDSLFCVLQREGCLSVFGLFTLEIAMFGGGHTLVTSFITTTAAASIIPSADAAYTSSNDALATGSHDLVETVTFACAAFYEDENYPGTDSQA